MQDLPIRHIVACTAGYQALAGHAPHTRFVMRSLVFCSICLAVLALALSASAQAQQPGVVTGGADGVTFNGKPAARTGDQTSGCLK
jgi:uncharacterized Zn-binding protein involved in type VI secretion